MNAAVMQEYFCSHQNKKGEKYHEKIQCGGEKGSGQAGGHGIEGCRVGGAEGDNSECTYMLLVRARTGQTA